jgi:hypothetical protein
MCRHPMGDAVGMSEVQTRHSVSLGGHRSKSLSVRKPFPHLELLGWPYVPRLWGGGGGQNRGLDLMQQGAFFLLLGGSTKDA